jgi:hypothetical protein
MTTRKPLTTTAPRYQPGDLVIVKAEPAWGQLGRVESVHSGGDTDPWFYLVKVPARASHPMVERELRRATTHDLDRHNSSWVEAVIAEAHKDARELVLAACWRLACDEVMRATGPGTADENERTRRLDLDYQAVLALASRLTRLEAEVERLDQELRQPPF